jgi:hypothetical protein
MVERHPETGAYIPHSARLRDARLDVEKRAVESASCLVFCTEGARNIVVERYALSGERTSVIPNGYDEAEFERAERVARAAQSDTSLEKLVLLHSGTIYASEDRDPSELFQALRALLEDHTISAETFELRLRNPSRTDYFSELAGTFGVSEIVNIVPGVAYDEALAEMLAVDGLLVLQGSTSNPAIPAKVYEYLRAYKPIVSLVDAKGETARLIESVGVRHQASLKDRLGIESLLRMWISDPEQLRPQEDARREIASYAREKLTGTLAAALDRVVAGG